MTTRERQYALYKAVEYIVVNQIEGDIVECGVWKGGSSMLIADALVRMHDSGRALYLYDTFAGMSEPSEIDVSSGVRALDKWKERQGDGCNTWDYAPLEEVKKNLAQTGYPEQNIHYVIGKVEDTIPATMPETISLLRLDTDWYESTKHELTHLFPRLSKDGVIIIDDYGHWEGAKAAVDEYLKENGVRLFLNSIDDTGRLAIKTT